MSDIVEKPKRGPGNPNWSNGSRVGQGRPKGTKDRGSITEILKAVKKVSGERFEMVLANHLYTAKVAYDEGRDYRSYTTMLLRLADICVEPIPKEVNVNVENTHHITLLEDQSQSIRNRLSQYAAPSIDTNVVDVVDVVEKPKAD